MRVGVFNMSVKGVVYLEVHGQPDSSTILSPDQGT